MTFRHRTPAPRLPSPRTREQLLQEATEHFDWVARRPSSLYPSAGEAQAAGRLGRLLVDAAMALEPDQVLDLGGWLEAHATQEGDKGRAVDALPYLCGQLGLLTMEFVHPSAGKLPVDTVRTLLETGQPVQYEGVELTSTNVIVQYRRTFAGAL